jgi:hypothetical protein
MQRMSMYVTEYSGTHMAATVFIRHACAALGDLCFSHRSDER